MREWQNQSHVRWYCRYHIIIVPKYRVAYLGAAANASGPLASRLRRVKQLGIRTRNAFSTLLPNLLADI